VYVVHSGIDTNLLITDEEHKNPTLMQWFWVPGAGGQPPYICDGLLCQSW